MRDSRSMPIAVAVAAVAPEERRRQGVQTVSVVCLLAAAV